MTFFTHPPRPHLLLLLLLLHLPHPSSPASLATTFTSPPPPNLHLRIVNHTYVLASGQPMTNATAPTLVAPMPRTPITSVTNPPTVIALRLSHPRHDVWRAHHGRRAVGALVASVAITMTHSWRRPNNGAAAGACARTDRNTASQCTPSVRRQRAAPQQL